MLNDLDIIDKLMYSGISLEKEEFIFGTNRKNSYFLENGLITGLLIQNIELDKKILHAISKLTNLKYLYLSKNKIKEIPKSFAKLIHLEELDLSNNQISSLPTYFANFIHLKWLDIKSNNITQIPDEFSNLLNIQKLDVSDTPIIKIPEAFYTIPNITIELDNTPIKRTNEYLENLSNNDYTPLCYKQDEYLYGASELRLDSLDNEEELQQIKDSLYYVPLESLEEPIQSNAQEIYESVFTPINTDNDFNSNEIREIYDLLEKNNQQTLTHSSVVTSLDLSYTNLKEIPHYLTKLKHLEWLDLSYTNIDEISKSICQLQNLKTLDLKGNHIKYIPISILKLKNLETLILDDNEISNIPPFIHEMSSLKNIYLNKNRITQIPNAIKEVKNLQLIDLRNNHIIDIPQELSHLDIRI